MRQNFIDVKIGTNRTFPIPTIWIFFSINSFFPIRLRGYLAGIDPYIGRHIQRSAMAVIIGKSIDVGSIFHRFCKINILPFLFTLVRFGPVPTKVPFTYHLGVITDFLEQMSHGCPVSGNQVLACSAKHSAGKS